MTAKEYAKHIGMSKAGVCQRIRKNQFLKGVRRVKKLGNMYILVMEK